MVDNKAPQQSESAEENMYRAIGRVEGLDRALDIFKAASDRIRAASVPPDANTLTGLVEFAANLSTTTLNAFEDMLSAVRDDIVNERVMLQAKLSHGHSDARH